MRWLVFGPLCLLACAADTFATNDGGGGTDAGSDAGSDVGSCVPTTPCNGTCTNFDQGTFNPPFNDQSSLGGTVDVVAGDSVSCPNALVAHLPQIAPGSGVGAQSSARAGIGVGFSVPAGTTPHASIDVEVKLPPNPTAPASFLVLGVPGDLMSAVTVSYDGNGWHLHVGLGADVTIKPLVGAWNHMTLTTTFSSDGGTSTTLDYLGTDGKPAQTAAINGATVQNGAALTSIGCFVGIGVISSTTGEMEARFDDLTFSAEAQ